MKKLLIILILISIIIPLCLSAVPRGYLFIIGGGDRSEAMMKRFVHLAGLFNRGKIIVFPMASSVPGEVGPEQAGELKKLGATEAEYHILSRERALDPQSVELLEGAGGVFFSGGVQSRLMDILIDTPLHQALLDLYEKGAVIGGTSAGAAVMSEIMITGDEKREVEEGYEFERLEANNIVTSPGIGFIRTAIIDQHFATRKRHNRLISLMAEKPELLGIGIDESTALIVYPDQTIEVTGEKNVIIYDASQADISILPSQAFGIKGLIMHILLPGERYDLKSKKVIKLYYPDSKPYTRWWWFSGTISREDVEYQLNWIKENFFGGVEIAWVYPLDLESNEERFEFLGKEWSEIAAYTKAYATSLGLGCDFTFGTLWPFGGSFVENKYAVKKFGESMCQQKQEKSWEYPVKGYVLNHMDKDALLFYSEKMISGLAQAMLLGRSAWFCDSWEVDTRYMWTKGFDTVFREKFGYDIKKYMPELYEPQNAQIHFDYMNLVSEYVIEEFYKPFTAIAHKNNAFTRVQCGGSPTDLLNAYAAVDVPESEAILFEPKFSRIPASAAALASKPEISAEAFTCLYGWKGWPGPGPYSKEEQTADLKLLADALFANGVNQIFWHGMPFNGKGDSNIFYATVHVGKDSNFKTELSSFNRYLQKISAIMKIGKTYSDAAVYLPLEDSWVQGEYPEDLQMPWAWGAYELRYIHFLKKGHMKNQRLICGDASFSFLYIDVDYMDREALKIVLDLAEKGFPICIKKSPKEPGKIKSLDYKMHLNQLISLDNVSSDLNKIVTHKPFLETSFPIEYWAKTHNGEFIIFLSHPKARKLKYPMKYGQSFCDGNIKEYIRINIPGKTFDVPLVFEPYQSILIRIDQEENLSFDDISFFPQIPKQEPSR